jgi:hypothetical protein
MIWASILLALIPEIPPLIAAIAALRKQYPQLTQEQILAIVADVTSQSDSAFDSALAKIAADQAAHPTT